MRQKTIQLALGLDGAGEAQTVQAGGGEAHTATPRPVTLAQPSGCGNDASLMEAVVAEENIRNASAKVRANRGSPGADGMTVDELDAYLESEGPTLRAALLAGAYVPGPIRRVDIPKPDGGTRQLGIPAVIDRLVQQCLLQVLSPIFDPHFSPSSYGFRPGKSANQALAAAREHVAAGCEWVVDIDLEKFFDRVNHDILMGRVAKTVSDKRVLRLIRSYVSAGILMDGVVVTRGEGTPQGGPLSPLLANILLDDLDKMLESRGHRFCRYADDCNIYVRSERAGQRVMASVTDFLERKLRLKVNRSKSAVARPKERKFLGQRVLGRGQSAYLGIHPKSVHRLQKRARLITRRNRGVNVKQVLGELGTVTDGWVAYHRHARCASLLERLDGWIRRRLRCYIWKQWKTTHRRAAQLLHATVRPERAYGVVKGHVGLWKCSADSAVQIALTNKCLATLGFHSLYERFVKLAKAQTASAPS